MPRFRLTPKPFVPDASAKREAMTESDARTAILEKCITAIRSVLPRDSTGYTVKFEQKEIIVTFPATIDINELRSRIQQACKDMIEPSTQLPQICTPQMPSGGTLRGRK